ncbi:hypothetical protein [Chitinilyticum piscinae]|uniref:Uncharacterized protein n=1 Tax=Chitinilyticum piscinae TaxID=2866724 RepID=A0A8J7FJL6_9NEIS|nr:hypothetical protein [Chitinilyticum piscinae]MBE9609077.1 hypothetical protein [Chitinilyticum piscinae]
MQIMITNLPSDASAESVTRLLHEELGLGAAHDITMAPGLGERVAALFSLDASDAAVHALIDKLNGYHWQGRTLGASHASMFKE